MLSTTLSGNYGFPLCTSGITQQLSLPREMADHDKRRKVIQRRRRRSEGSHGGEEDAERLQGMREDKDVRDLVALLQDLGLWSFSSHTAKAA
ncbi:PREDICTED: uncharacterized protein LOC104726632 isoform X2 [Camelina sativa]|uniref:Uncharacterized protein LOC104726632 isoform X2 n=1 Tax=Camelina sativa TaxID=90675 RepID=A0ABM0UNQ0_CAMSA|nr:PREDICTED: uncharacterized protein LOC104726632 isoform X2 [Camelina sativa]